MMNKPAFIVHRFRSALCVKIEYTMIDHSSPFARRMLEIHGEEGAAWLAALPAMLDEYARRWELELEPAPWPFTYSVVLPARRADGTNAILKLAPPEPEWRSGAEALRWFDGHGCARLLEAEVEAGALLLERLSPGTTLTQLDDDERATSIAGRVMRELWRPLPPQHPFITVEYWASGLAKLRERFGGGSGPVPEPLLALAEDYFAELLATAPPAVLLHGDLHHDNVLAAERAAWLAIDPKGIAGEPAFEPAQLFTNPGPWLRLQPDLRPIMRRRLDILADETGLERERIRGYGIGKAVLSAWWDIEEGAGSDWFEQSLAVAQALSEMT